MSQPRAVRETLQPLSVEPNPEVLAVLKQALDITQEIVRVLCYPTMVIKTEVDQP